MAIILTVLILLFQPIFLINQTEEKGWKRIMPLRSTKKDVEEILGSPKENNLYETEKEKIIVWYSKGRCRRNKSSNWNVPKDTVLTFTVIPKEKLLISTFINSIEGQFKREIDYKSEGIYHYYNEDHSVFIETRILPEGGEDIILIDYLPTTEDKKFRCK